MRTTPDTPSPQSPYARRRAALQAAAVSEQPLLWYGFVLGAVAGGMVPGAPPLSRAAGELLNGGAALEGRLVAALTTLALEAEEALRRDDDEELLGLPPATADAGARLTALSELCHGLCLALGLKQDGAMRQDRARDELLRDLSAFTRVDPEAELDEDDLKTVTHYISDRLRSLNLDPPTLS